MEIAGLRVETMFSRILRKEEDCAVGIKDYPDFGTERQGDTITEQEKMTMVQWKCNQCNYIIAASEPPEKCPSCKQQCVFIDVSCYTPECGGPDSGNIDPQLVGGGKPER